MIEMYYIVLAFCMIYVCVLYHVGYEQLAELWEEEWNAIAERFVNYSTKKGFNFDSALCKSNLDDVGLAPAEPPTFKQGE